MCTYFICLAGLLAALILAEPVSCEEVERGNAPAQSLCPFVRSAANQTQPEAEASAVLPEQEGFGAAGTEALPARPEEKSSSPRGPKLPAARKIIESLLADKVFFKDLAPQQRTLILHLPARCGVATNAPSLPASVFQQFDASQRSTFVGITHALLYTILVDSQDGKDLGDVLQLVEELLDIQGENSALPSDHQFQLIVRLVPDASQTLDRAAHFEKGENHVFHKGYPISFRQFRQIGLRGQEAGLHLNLTRDRRYAQIHIDYRFGLLHLCPANSDVRADGNHQRHADRWPQFKFIENKPKCSTSCSADKI